MQIPKPPKYNKAEDRKNSLLVLELDQNSCQWCRFQKGITKEGSFPHHVYGRRQRWDVDAQITLCYTCHADVHTARQVNGVTVIDKNILIDLMEKHVIPARANLTN